MSALLGTDPWLIFDVSNRYRDKRREVRVHGRDGVAVMMDPDGGEIEITRGHRGATTAGTSTSSRRYSEESALKRELVAFLKFLSGGPPPKSTAAEGAEVVRCISQLRALAGLDD
jgi:hypothetical protein